MADPMILFDPSAPPRTAPDGAQAPLARVNLDGAVVGVIDNAKPNFNHLAADLAECLTSTYGVRRVIVHRKPSASIPATDEVLEELASQCDLVITGSGD